MTGSMHKNCFTRGSTKSPTVHIEYREDHCNTHRKFMEHRIIGIRCTSSSTPTPPPPTSHPSKKWEEEKKAEEKNSTENEILFVAFTADQGYSIIAGIISGRGFRVGNKECRRISPTENWQVHRRFSPKLAAPASFGIDRCPREPNALWAWSYGAGNLKEAIVRRSSQRYSSPFVPASFDACRHGRYRCEARNKDYLSGGEDVAEIGRSRGRHK